MTRLNCTISADGLPRAAQPRSECKPAPPTGGSPSGCWPLPGSTGALLFVLQ
jgi:hypothetical protein